MNFAFLSCYLSTNIYTKHSYEKCENDCKEALSLCVLESRSTFIASIFIHCKIMFTCHCLNLKTFQYGLSFIYSY